MTAAPLGIELTRMFPKHVSLIVVLAFSIFANTIAARAGVCHHGCRSEARLCHATCTDLGGRARRACRARCDSVAGCTTARGAIRTLAYVVSECREVPDGVVGHQKLVVRRGNCDPVTVAEAEATTTLPDPIGLCRTFGRNRVGPASPIAGVFQRLAVSPDGSRVVFELTDDFSILPVIRLEPAQEGIFSVRADGTERKLLGPASRETTFRVTVDPASPSGFGFNWGGAFKFSPDGRRVTFTDRGPGPSGEDAGQVVTLDLSTGHRRQITHLPPSSPPDPLSAPVSDPAFVDDDTVVFSTYANPDGQNPEHELRSFSARIDGHRLRPIPQPVALPGSRVIPRFQVTGTSAQLLVLNLPGTPTNPQPGLAELIQEVFLVNGSNLLQLTNFHRVDTNAGVVGRDRRVLVEASADPSGANPTENCQLFGVGALGEGLRQLTHFSEGVHSDLGCNVGPPPGCSISQEFQDRFTGAIVFYSSCDPFGANPFSGQLFAMRPDSSGLRQLTRTRGQHVDAEGYVTVELPGPLAYSAAVN